MVRWRINKVLVQGGWNVAKGRLFFPVKARPSSRWYDYDLCLYAASLVWRSCITLVFGLGNEKGQESRNDQTVDK